MTTFYRFKIIQNKTLPLAIALPAILACSHMENTSQGMQAPDTANTREKTDTIQDGLKFLDLKELPRYVFGCYMVPYMEREDIRNLLLTAKSIRLTLWKELPFIFKGKEGAKQLEQYLVSPQSLVPIAAIALKQYIAKNYPLAVEKNKVVLPSLTPLPLHKRVKMVDLLAIKSDMFLQFLNVFKDIIIFAGNKTLQEIPFKSIYHPRPDSLTYTKARLLTSIYDYLSFPNILNLLQIPDGTQERDAIQHAICTDLTALTTLQGAQANDTQRKSAQRLLQDILATGGSSWISRFDFVQMASCSRTFFLNYEAACGYTEVSKQLIRFGADVNEKNCATEIPLHYAAAHGHLGSVQFLLANDACISHTDLWERTPFAYAARFGHLGIMNILLTQGADINRTDCNGWSPLHFAARYGHLDAVAFLLANHAHVDQPNHLGRTPLSWASQFGHADIVNMLLAQGVFVNSSDHLGATPLCYACKGDCLEVVRLVLEKGASIHKKSSGESILHIAAHHNAPNVAKLLIKRGCDVNARNSSGATPLHRVIDAGHRQPANIIRLLVENNADINAKNAYGYTPLMIAISRQFTLETAELLIAHGADIDIAHPTQGTPLQWAQAGLKEAQLSIWHDITGNPPYASKRAKLFLALAKQEGIQPSLQPLCYQAVPHKKTNKTCCLSHLMLRHRTIPQGLIIGPQETSFILSQQPQSIIKQMFGTKTLQETDWIRFYQQAIELLEKVEAAQNKPVPLA